MPLALFQILLIQYRVRRYLGCLRSIGEQISYYNSEKMLRKLLLSSSYCSCESNTKLHIQSKSPLSLDENRQNLNLPRYSVSRSIKVSKFLEYLNFISIVRLILSDTKLGLAEPSSL